MKNKNNRYDACVIIEYILSIKAWALNLSKRSD